MNGLLTQSNLSFESFESTSQGLPIIILFTPSTDTDMLQVRGINSDGKDTSFILSRVFPEPVRPYLFDAMDGSYPPAPSPRPSSLPPPGHLQLELTLASKIGSGRVGHVYALDDS